MEEEVKVKRMKPVVGEAHPQSNEHPGKMSYEQMVDIANQLQSQNRELMMRLQNLSTVYHRLDYLFKVLENAVYFSKEFVETCSKEVESIITIPAEDNTPEDTKEN